MANYTCRGGKSKTKRRPEQVCQGILPTAHGKLAQDVLHFTPAVHHDISKEAHMACQCGEKHEGHICMLKSKGMLEEVRHLGENPSVVCFMCGAQAGSADNVCEPMPLKQ